MKELKKYRVVLCVSILVALIPIVRSVLEFKYDRSISFPFWFNLILIIIGQIIPLIYSIKLRSDEDNAQKGRHLSSLLLASSVINLNLLKLSPYYYVKFDGLTVLSAYLKYFSTVLILIAVVAIYLVITNIMKMMNKGKGK